MDDITNGRSIKAISNGMIHELPQQRRRSIRLQGYNYSTAGAYFITICTKNRECLFGQVVGATGGCPEITGGCPEITGSRPEMMGGRLEMVLNQYGIIVRDEWIRSASIRSEIELDEFVVMPNHFHGIVIIRRGDRPVAPTGRCRPRLKTGKQMMNLYASGYNSILVEEIL